MIPAWREMSFRDGICCDDAQRAAETYIERAKDPHSVTEIVKNILEGLPSTSHTPLMIRQHKRNEMSISLQTLLCVISSTFPLIVSSSESFLLQTAFRKISFGLVQLLEDGASSYLIETFVKLTFFSSSHMVSAIGTSFIYSRK
jgi:hypothetical protein